MSKTTSKHAKWFRRPDAAIAGPDETYSQALCAVLAKQATPEELAALEQYLEDFNKSIFQNLFSPLLYEASHQLRARINRPVPLVTFEENQ